MPPGAWTIPVRCTACRLGARRPGPPARPQLGLCPVGPVGGLAGWAVWPSGGVAFSPLFFLSFVFLFYLFSFIYFLLRIYIILVL